MRTRIPPCGTVLVARGGTRDGHRVLVIAVEIVREIAEADYSLALVILYSH
jgi:hypothetical protein